MAKDGKNTRLKVKVLKAKARAKRVAPLRSINRRWGQDVDVGGKEVTGRK